MALKRAVKPLAQSLRQTQFEPQSIRERTRRLLRALQIARINRVDTVFASKACSELFGLQEAVLGQRNVDMPLNALDAIPVGLAVPDEKDLSRHGRT